LSYGSEIVGQLILGPRSPGESWSPNDRRLLLDLARQSGTAVHAMRLTLDLQHARTRLVTAREEERRRLRRDLHDGLGPTLAALALQADTARDLLRSDPDEAEALLDNLTQQSQAAVVDIRRLVYALRPPALDDLGLIVALRTFAGTLASGGVAVTIAAPEPFAPLPAAVEVAAYRIIQEALTNVVRHAHARRCTIRLSIASRLAIEVADDGRGIAPDAQAGVGLQSMRERARELGGDCYVERATAGGTIVRGWLPLE
ncbi:MAG TPA: sensor histidine kinase, partial [Herpetosiphonaceae bacterium]